jgi:hypothetical protein
LVGVALEQRIINKFTVQILASELREAITVLSTGNIEKELEGWIFGAEITDISIRGNAVSASLDLSELAGMYYDTYGEDSPMAKELVETDAGQNTIEAMYGLLSRFPTIGEVTVVILVNGDAYYAYRCTRRQFEEIGADSFERAGAEGNPQPILDLLTRIGSSWNSGLN